MKIFSKTEKKGSALLVVLGFLTFMMISAVSFAIYMRTERQASSNYRHSLTARHLLESALYRAIDEVDADLRTAAEKKFPTHWKGQGRVFTSKSNLPDVESARVLSLEALSFLPPALVNDARYYSMGTEWRRMSMPIEGNIDINPGGRSFARSSGGKSYVGRYAYICVNMSDMLNINGCTNAVRGASNLVSVASLFADENSQLIDWTKAEQFSQQAGKDVFYATLQDFYACMVDKTTYFTDPSPYIQFLRSDGNAVFSYAKKHLLVADGFAKAPPPRYKEFCNLGLPKGQPFTKGALELAAGAVAPPLQSEFVKAFRQAFSSTPSTELDAYMTGVLPGLLADYLADDKQKAFGLGTPAVKLAPMICQFVVDDFGPQIKAHVEGSGNNAKKVIDLQLFNDLKAPTVKDFGLKARVCYPFKNISADRRKDYTLRVEGFISVIQNRKKETTSTTLLSPSDEKRFRFDGDGVFKIDDPTLGVPAVPANENACYGTVMLQLKSDAFNNVSFPMIDEDGKIMTPGFAENKDFSVVFAIEKAEMKNASGQIVDQVPYNPLVAAVPGIAGSTPVFYFETKPTKLVRNLAPVPSIPYDWLCLEVPDPRFNHHVKNWISYEKADTSYSAKGMHKMTRDLLGKDGRDGDIFMSVSTRRYLESPGELGFIIRPFARKGDGETNFRERNVLDPNRFPDDSEAYFRTIRLYKHSDNHPEDKVYGSFINSVDDEGRLAMSNVRVNPLTTSKDILKMAIHSVPYDYSKTSKNSKDNLTDGILKAEWSAFSEKWATDVMKVVETENLVSDLTKNISTCDGIPRMAWYSPAPDRQSCLGVALTKPLYEIDRKMLYAFSLDSMSDRQQLFLYVFQAEAIAPISFADVRSLAGGRAVAVVWRDPFPTRDPKDRSKELAGTWYDEVFSDGSKGYHENKILFFKQLDN